MKNKTLFLTILVGLIHLCLAPCVLAQEASDFLILEDIGVYKYTTAQKNVFSGQTGSIPGYFQGKSPGKLAMQNHFELDHDDMSFETKYYYKQDHILIMVEVTEHAGGKSDEWILHEAERDFRHGEGAGKPYSPLRNLDGGWIFQENAFKKMADGSITQATRCYRWISGNVVVDIECGDLKGMDDEPLDVINAYLAKYPSSMQPTTFDEAHNIKWIKDEMERRLWLCDGWLSYLGQGKVSLEDTIDEIVQDLELFFNYCQTYYGEDVDGYLETLVLVETQGDLSAAKTLLDEAKDWWAANKESSISVP